jgi:exosome complex exonuclease DIS3/RRP44
VHVIVLLFYYIDDDANVWLIHIYYLTSGADSTYKELLDKRWTQNIANNINYRHRMAQYASRASVNLHTHIFFKNQVRPEQL